MGSKVSLSRNITNKPALSDVEDMQTFWRWWVPQSGTGCPPFKGQCLICFPPAHPKVDDGG